MLLRDAERKNYRVGFSPIRLTERTVDIRGMDSQGHWAFSPDENVCVVYRSAEQGGYPIIGGDELQGEVWKLLPED